MNNFILILKGSMMYQSEMESVERILVTVILRIKLMHYAVGLMT
jgi:hypothetical protein